VSLGRKLKKYLSNPGAALDFDSESDRRIAEAQKFAILTVCGLLVPGLAFLLAYWGAALNICGAARSFPRARAVQRQQRATGKQQMVGPDRRYDADFLTAYFLRRLAIARRKPLYKGDPGAAHWDALVEVIFIAVAAPFFGIISFLLILSLRWLTPSQAATLPIPSKYVGAIGGWILCVIIGRQLLGRRFKRFLHDQRAASDYDSDHDRWIAESQRIAALILCGLIAPAVAFLIAFWGRL